MSDCLKILQSILKKDFATTEMPIVDSSYQPPRGFRGRHIQTLYPTLFRHVRLQKAVKRERLTLSDGDFLDIDLLQSGFPRMAILFHGLEGSSEAHYMRGMARYLHRKNWDVLLVNFRGCSGETNQRYRSYHSGATDDLHEVIEHVEKNYDYEHLGLVGFSLGGNVVLKYLGESPVTERIKVAATLSVPCDLEACASRMAEPQNALYMRRFMRLLYLKMKDKKAEVGLGINLDLYKRMKTFREFDDAYTAPAHGYFDAHDYWKRCSSLPLLENIDIPTLLINAKDDSFLSPSCYPTDIAEKNENLYLDIPEHGGHLGFVSFGEQGVYWHEKRVGEFFKNFGWK